MPGYFTVEEVRFCSGGNWDHLCGLFSTYLMVPSSIRGDRFNRRRGGGERAGHSGDVIGR